MQHTTGGEIILRGIHATHPDAEADTDLFAQLLLDGDAPARLEQLVARLSLEPGIRAVHRHTTVVP